MFEVKQNGNNFDIYTDGRFFTTCHYDHDCVRPYIGPVMSSHGVSFTRADVHNKEHPHQRSVFVGIGDINGADFWNEHETDNAVISLDKVLAVQGGENALVSVKNTWITTEGENMLDEVRTAVFSEAGKDCIRLDIKLVLTAAYYGITVGETKEAGPLAVRVNELMRADGEGTFCNSEGGIKEEGCWGKTARWCNYSAVIDGKKIGIAMFDRKTNERWPTAWHIRNYGLMAANNLYFKGPYDLAKGQSIEYNFTICFWENEIDEEKFADR